MEKYNMAVFTTKAMTDLNLPATGSRRLRAGVKRASHHAPRTDMTPMVDLAFLLITFFVMTAQMQEPTVMSLIMPKDGPAQPVGATESMTVLLSGENKLYYYEGITQEALPAGKMQPVPGGVKELRDILIRKQRALDDFKGRDRLMVLVKPTASSKYRLLIDALDELKITGVTRFAVIDPDEREMAMLH
ncbi:ExbD/TolR family protein [Terrimonas ferruginea]|uniref:ExbD/TolR family protein n=1 Tax=Terrimonas ferruginea TaxID=249 RepID=UPI00042A4EFC|nr:biopolymer transporter ExbD [Terrimonas ferruginea]